jgi:REP element-mobilizing transposase RayT
MLVLQVCANLRVAMKFNPDIHHRRSIRLKNFDYSRDGAYFVTLCTFDRGCHFERFGQLRQIVEAQWYSLPARFPGVALDEFVIMPNHFHGIIVLSSVSCENPHFMHSRSGHPQGVPLQNPKIGDIVGAFKSLCVNEWLKIITSENINTTGKFWQHNYYEHVIRNDVEMDRIRQYIADNPQRWALDRENPDLGEKQQQQIEHWMV